MNSRKHLDNSSTRRISNSYTQKSIGLDPGFGTSASGVRIAELRDGLVNVLHAEEYPKPQSDDMIRTTVKLIDEHDIRFENGCRVFVDGVNPSFIRALKDRVDEGIEYEQINYDLRFLQQNMLVIPVPFSKYHK